MTWSASLSGHTDDQQGEQQIADQLRQLAQTVDATNGTFYGQFGTHELLTDQPAAAPAEEPASQPAAQAEPAAE